MRLQGLRPGARAPPLLWPTAHTAVLFVVSGIIIILVIHTASNGATREGVKAVEDPLLDKSKFRKKIKYRVIILISFVFQ